MSRSMSLLPSEMETIEKDVINISKYYKPRSIPDLNDGIPMEDIASQMHKFT
jgi:hypothetical protein